MENWTLTGHIVGKVSGEDTVSLNWRAYVNRYWNGVGVLAKGQTLLRVLRDRTLWKAMITQVMKGRAIEKNLWLLILFKYNDFLLPELLECGVILIYSIYIRTIVFVFVVSITRFRLLCPIFIRCISIWESELRDNSLED